MTNEKLQPLSQSVGFKPVLCILACIATAGILFAQVDRGLVEGTVTDPSGAAVAKAKVQVINIDTNSTLDFSTNDLGYYLAPNLPIGWYRVTVQKEGFKTLVREPVSVSAQSSFRVDFTLQLGSASQTVSVSAEAPLLDIAATTVPNNLTAKFINEMPLLNFSEKGNITDELRLLPGDTSSNGSLNSGEPAESWSGRVNSALQGESEVFLDGAPASEWTTRRGSILENGPAVEAVAEYTVVANSFNAEYGGFGSWYTTVNLNPARTNSMARCMTNLQITI